VEACGSDGVGDWAKALVAKAMVAPERRIAQNFFTILSKFTYSYRTFKRNLHSFERL
jgi:hypothetical protein